MNRVPLKASLSLWSADLTNLEAELRRSEPYADLYHIDVSDGTYAEALLFFPDLVAAIRKKTDKPLEVHLITEQPQRWVRPFAEAGADYILFYPDTVDNPQAMIEAIRAAGCKPGMALAVENPAHLVAECAQQLAIVCVLGTDFGVKGVKDIAPGTYEKIVALAKMRAARAGDFEIEADGAIRRHTVPRLRAAGADIIVPGSLMFGDDMAETSAWIKSLE